MKWEWQGASEAQGGAGLLSLPGGGEFRSRGAKVAEFISVCIEMFAKAKRLSGDKVAVLFASCGAIDYLDSGYEMLHTQGEGWLVAELDGFLKSRGIVA